MIYVDERPKTLKPMVAWDPKAMQTVKTTTVVSVCECEPHVYGVTTEYGQLMVTTDRKIAVSR